MDRSRRLSRTGLDQRPLRVFGVINVRIAEVLQQQRRPVPCWGRVSGSMREIRRLVPHVAYFPTIPGMPKVCATSRRSTFPPSAMRVRWLKALAEFSPQYQLASHKEGVFQIIGPTKRGIEKGVADGIVAANRRPRALTYHASGERRVGASG